MRLDGRLEATRYFGLDLFGGTPVATKEALITASGDLQMW